MPTTETLYKRALWLAYFTVLYNVAEGVVSILVGRGAGSIALVGFGLDSFIESLSGCVVVWRVRQHGRVPAERELRVEAKATRLIGVTFFILAASILYESAKRLLSHEAPSPTAFGIGIAVVSILMMFPLFHLKRVTAGQLGSASLTADSKETLACALLSWVLLAGLGLNYLFALWWADPVAGILIALYLAKEGWETVRGEEEGED